MQRGERLTHCKRGHEFTAENIKYKNGPRGRYRNCRECFRLQRRSSRKYDPISARIRNLAAYGMNNAVFDSWVQSQDNKCKICDESFSITPFIDHDRSCCNKPGSCGQCIRGLLCRNCNSGLGLFQDNTKILQKAINYLRAWEQNAK